MSIEAVSRVLNTKVGDSTRKLVLLGIANHTDSLGRGAFRAVQAYADYADCSERTAQRHIRILLQEGYIREGDQELVSHYRVGHRPVVYDVALDEATRQQWQAARGDNLTPHPRGDNLTPQEVDTEASGSWCGVTPVSPKPLTTTTTSYRSLLTSSEEPSTRSPSGAARRRTSRRALAEAERQEEEALDPRKIADALLADEDSPAEPGTPTEASEAPEGHMQNRRRRPRAKSPWLKLAEYFRHEAREHSEHPEPANVAALARKFREWDLPLATTRTMIEKYWSPEFPRKPDVVPWVDFLAARAALLDVAEFKQAGGDLEKHRYDDEHWQF